MNIKDLVKNVANLTGYEFERKLNRLVRENYRFRNLGPANRRIILDLVKKYKPYLRKGVGISYSTRQNDLYKLYKNRIKLNLSEYDLKNIKEILSYFKK